jgi:oleate hydratase
MVSSLVPTPGHAYLVGGGIASLAAAAFLIRDGNMPGPHIHIFEEASLLGGSLDGAGQAEQGYVLRGGRMLNFTYRCTYDLLASIPSLEHAEKSVYDDIIAFNEQIKTHALARVVDCDGHIVDVTPMGFTEPDRLDIVELLAVPEHRNQFLVYVGHHVCLPALAQLGRVQALPAALSARVSAY